MKKISTKKGVALVEVVVAAAIIASSFVAILGIYTGLSRLSYKSLPHLQAAMLAEEGIEAVRSMRDVGFSSEISGLSVGAEYFLQWEPSDSMYHATTSVVSIDSTFYRTLKLENVYRDGNYNIASSGTIDPDSKLLTIKVDWQSDGGTSTYQLQSYVFNTFNN